MAEPLLTIPTDTEGILVSRVNRFLAHVMIRGHGADPVPVHVHDPGRLRELLFPGNRLLLARAKNPRRKTAWDVVAALGPGGGASPGDINPGEGEGVGNEDLFAGREARVESMGRWETDPGDMGPGDAGPGDRERGEAEPGEAGPGDLGPGKGGRGEAGPGDVGPGKGGRGEAGPGDVAPVDMSPGAGEHGDTGANVKGPGRRDQWVLIHAGYHPRIARAILSRPSISPFGEVEDLRSEVTVGNCRMDFLLRPRGGGRRVLIEVKGCSLTEDGTALFPDAPTERGSRHLETLINSREKMRAALLILVFRSDSLRFAPHGRTDPAFAEAFHRAVDAGVEIYPALLEYRDGEVWFHGFIPVCDRENGR